MKIANANIVARRHLYASTKQRFTGSQRNLVMKEVWDMLVQSYKHIGVPLTQPEQMMKYDVWDLDMSGNKPVAFTLYKKTRYGLKSGAGGFDGSSEGKSAALRNIRTKFSTPGVYGEVSHKVLSIALKAGAPVVCANLAGKVIGKNVDVVGDLAYKRSITNIGTVEKTLVGRPVGVPTTDSANPQCDIKAASTLEMAGEDEHCDWVSHCTCVAW